MADVDLLFGVEGGGAISGASGKKIRNQLTNIIGNVNKQIPGIKITLDAGSLSNCENQLKKLTKTAMAEADKIQSAYSTVNFTPDQQGKESGGKSGRKSSNDETRRLNALKKYENLLTRINKAQRNWTSAGKEEGGVAKSFEDIGHQAKALEDIIYGLENKLISLADAEAAYVKISEGFAKSTQIINEKGLNTKEDDTYVKKLKEIGDQIDRNEKLLRNWSKAKTGDTKDAFSDIEEGIETLKKLRKELEETGIATAEWEGKFKGACAQIAKGSAVIEPSGRARKTFGDSVFGVVDELAGYIDVIDVAFEAYETGRKMVEAVTEIDTAMTELKKVTDETNASYNAFLDEASIRAKDLGATVSDVVSSSADFARLGYDLDEAASLADAALVYKNVGDGISDIETASSSIISTMQAFGIEASNAMSVVDSFNAIGNNFAISSGGVGDALLNSAASLHAAGNDIHESVALIAAANTTIQNPGRVGTALKTLSMYLRAAKTEAEDAGISTDGMADSVSQLRDELMALTGGRVDIMSDAEAGSYKSTVEILRELSQVWDDLSDTSKTNITELIGGGVRNANIISALMNNFDIVDKAIETSAHSSGSALAENEKYLDSIAGKTAKFNAAFETMSSTMVDSDLIKSVVDAGTNILEAGTFVADHFGGALAAFAGGRIIDTISSLDKLITKDSNLYNFFNMIKGVGSDAKANFRALGTGLSGFFKEIKSGAKLTDVFSKSLGDMWSSLSVGGKASAIGLGIGAVITIVGAVKDHIEKQIQVAQENAEAYKESADSIKDYKKESLDLINSIESGTLSDEERYKARSRLNEIEKELTKTYGEQAKNLKLLSQNAEGTKANFEQFERDQAGKYYGENKKNIESAITRMTRNRISTLGTFDWKNMSSEARSAIEQIVAESDSLRLGDSTDGLKYLNAVGNARELLDAANKINSVINTSGSYISDHFNSNISNTLSYVGDIVDTYGTQYDAGVSAAIAKSEDYTGILKSIEGAEASYTKAMSDSYDSTIDRADALKQAQDTVNSSINSYKEQRDSIAADNAGVAEYFDNQVEGLEKYNSVLSFGSDILSATYGGEASNNIVGIVDALDKLRNASGELDSDFINDIGLGLEDGIADGEQEEAFVALTEALAAYNLELQDVIPVMKAFGIMRKSTGEMLSDATAAYNSVLAEQQAVTNAYGSQAAGKSVSIETYESLIALSDEYASCLEYENGAIQFNRQKLMELSKARAEENLQTIQANKLDAQKRYAENAEAIKKYQDSIRNATEAEADQVDLWEKEIKSLQDKNKEIENSIVNYELMAEAVENSISAYSEWVRAQSETQSGAWHASASSGLEQLKELYNNREYGNTVLQEGLEFFTDANITGLDSWQERVTAIDGAYKQLTATIDGTEQGLGRTSYSLSDFMQGGRTGANNFLNAVQQLNKEWASFDQSTQEWTLNYDNAQLADALGTTEEFVVMMNSLLEQYGFKFDSSKLMTTEEKSIKEATDLVEKYKKTVEDTDDLSIETVDGSKVQETEAQVADIATQLAALPRETLVKLGFNLEGVADGDLVGAIQEQLPNISVPVKSDSITEEQTVLVKYEKDSSEVDGYDPPDLTRTVTYELKKSGSVPGGSVVTGSVTGAAGAARVSGTAMTTGHPSVPGGRTLVGELGREMYVDPSTNTWHTIGDNGAEFVNLPKNAIVFNHMQTSSLLKNGRISARGKALVTGDPVAGAVAGAIKKNIAADTVNSVVVVVEAETSDNPSATGSGPKIGDPSGKNKSGGSSSKNNEKKSKKSFDDLYKKHNHLREMDKETDEEYLKWLEGAYKEAYKNGEISLDDYRKYAEEVYELKKELFQDSLNDMEHEISILERESGNESEIIGMYQEMMGKIQKEIKAAKKRGLDDDSEYVQNLKDQYYEYADAIEEIQNEITNNATSAVEDLINYKIDMIKKDLENEKDALNEKLDDLKDFYDKQKQMLRDARDEEKYLDEQSEKRKSVSDIQAEIAQLSLDNSAWAQKRKLELQEELVKAQKELDEFEKDHALDTTEEFLDKMYEQQAEQIKSQISAIDEKLNDPNALYNQALTAIQNNTAELYHAMVDYNNKYGDGNPETVSKMWDEAYDSLKSYLELFGEAYKNIVLVGSSSTISGYAGGTRRATPGPHKVFENGDEYIFQASDGARYKMFSGGEKVLNAKATNFLYDFAMSGGKILANMLPGLMGNAALSRINRPSQPIQLSTGNIIIEGNANERTVSEIRRAQREGIDYILKEFTRLNK